MVDEKMPFVKNWFTASTEEMLDHLNTCDKHVANCKDCSLILAFMVDDFVA